LNEMQSKINNIEQELKSMRKEMNSTVISKQ